MKIKIQTNIQNYLIMIEFKIFDKEYLYNLLKIFLMNKFISINFALLVKKSNINSYGL
jgi:hypothetical protein